MYFTTILNLKSFRVVFIVLLRSPNFKIFCFHSLVFLFFEIKESLFRGPYFLGFSTIIGHIIGELRDLLKTEFQNNIFALEYKD